MLLSKVAQSFDSQKLCRAPSGAGLCGYSTLASLQAAEFETRELRATRYNFSVESRRPSGRQRWLVDDSLVPGTIDSSFLCD